MTVEAVLDILIGGVGLYMLLTNIAEIWERWE